MFREQTILSYTINKAMARILRKGFRKPRILKLSVKVFLACQKLGIPLHPKRNRRSEEEMVVADR